MTVTDPGIAQIQVLLRRALAEVDRVLAPSGCRYFLAYGTALGARRHGDLVPWDVDADLYVPSADQPRAIEALQAGLAGTDFAVEAPGDPGYEYLFPRVVLRGVHHTLIRVDLFPLDVAPDSALARRVLTPLLKITAQLHMLRVMDLGERRHYDRRKAAVARLARAVLSVVPPRAIAGAHRGLVTLAGRLGRGDLLVNSCGSYGAREYVPARWFTGGDALDLGGLALPAPAPVEEYLRHVYGDFLSPPPDDRIAHEIAFAREHYVEPLRSAGVLDDR